MRFLPRRSHKDSDYANRLDEQGETMEPTRQPRPEIDRTMLLVGVVYACVLLAFVVRAAATLP
ncbi:MAG: hypothetical protein AAGH76_01885 [Pseudomonadota bacterium]